MTTATLERESTIKRIGNSQGVIIPRAMCRALNLKVGDPVAMAIDGDDLVVTPREPCTLEALMAGYDGPKPAEYDWGAPAGREMW